MSNRTKQQSDAAFAELRKYLRGDGKAIELLDMVDRYMGDLRRTKSLVKQDNENLQRTNQRLRDMAQSHSATVAAIRAELEAERAARRQEMSGWNKLSAIVEEWSEKLNRPSGHPEIDQSDWWKMFLSLKKRLPIPPAPQYVVEDSRGGKMFVFDLRNFVKPNGEVTFDACLSIGLLAMVAALTIMQTIGFTVVDYKAVELGNDKQLREQFNKRSTIFVEWCREWLDLSTLEIDVALGNHSGLPFHADGKSRLEFLAERIKTATGSRK